MLIRLKKISIIQLIFLSLIIFSFQLVYAEKFENINSEIENIKFKKGNNNSDLQNSNNESEKYSFITAYYSRNFKTSINEVVVRFADEANVCTPGSDTITILGDNFGTRRHFVKLGEYGDLSICTANNFEIVAECPDGKCSEGEYLLSFSKTARYKTVTDFSLTIGGTGEVGPAGPQGEPGEIGPAGPQGEMGLPGNDGAVGPQGEMGAAGPQGEIGPAGKDGIDGGAGSIGPAGPQGETGATGPAGADGAIGPQGPAGVQGVAGPAGPAGAIGPAGPQGVMGLPGTNGADGAPGATGPAGAIGPAGPQGVMGLPGTNGADGAPGATGPAGPAGAIGPAGPQGVMGLPGTNGADGAPGPAGADGAPGMIGMTGPQGIPGPEGPIGPVGPQGDPGLSDGNLNGQILTWTGDDPAVVGDGVWIAQAPVHPSNVNSVVRNDDNMQPYTAINYIIALQGIFPSRSSNDAYIGEIFMFAGNFAPRSFAFCNGQLLPIASNSALFSILGTTYGGDGRTTFALPDLRGRVAVHSGGNSTGPGLSTRNLGSRGGTEEEAPHTHGHN